MWNMQPLQLGGGEEWLSAQWDGSANAIRWTSTWHAGGLARRPVWPEQDEQRERVVGFRWSWVGSEFPSTFSE